MLSAGGKFHLHSGLGGGGTEPLHGHQGLLRRTLGVTNVRHECIEGASGASGSPLT